MCLHWKRGGGCGRDRDACAYVVTQLANSASVWKGSMEGEGRRKKIEKMNEKGKECTKIKNQRRTGTASSRSKNQGSNQWQKTTTDAARKKPAGRTCWKTRIMQKMDGSVDLNAEQIHQGVMEMVKHLDTCVEKHSGEEEFRTLTDISKPISLGKPQNRKRKTGNMKGR